MLDSVIKRPDAANPMTSSYFYELINCLVSYFVVDSSDERYQQDQSKHDQRMSEIIGYIEENYAQFISLNDLADRLHLAYSYVSRYFKKVFGMGFLEYINSVRLRHAVEDLLYTDKPITRVAVDNGFVNSSGLNKAFKDSYGVAPTVYKKRMLSKRFREDAEGNRISYTEDVYRKIRAYLSEKGVEERGITKVRRCAVQADGTQKQPYVKNWQQCINIGRAADLCGGKLQEQVLYLRDQLGFRYVRLWGIFNSDIELRPGHQTEDFNYDKLDEVLDFLVYNNLIPWLELGDKPLVIAKNTRNVVRMNTGEPVFETLTEYQEVLRRFLHHVITRYQADRVCTWRFECWNDERFDRQSVPVSYLDIFNQTYREIKSLLPEAQVGGSGMRINDVFAEALLRAWLEQPCQPDFFTVMSYPYEPINDTPDATQYTRSSTDGDFHVHYVDRVNVLLEKTGMHVPLVVTEWGASISSRNYLNDSCYLGTYILKNVCQLLGKTDVLSFFAGSDLISTYYDSIDILNGCLGLLTKDGICKPSFYAFQFLQRLGPYLVQSGSNYLLTATDHDSYYAVCFNHHPLNAKYYRKTEDAHSVTDVQNMEADGSPLHIDFRLTNIPSEKYTIKTSIIGPNNGSVLDEWIRLNTISHARKEDINYLKRICTPHMSIREMTAEDGVLRFGIELMAEEFALIHIYRI